MDREKFVDENPFDSFIPVKKNQNKTKDQDKPAKGTSTQK